MRKYLAVTSAIVAVVGSSVVAFGQEAKLDFRPPSVPLVAHDPYLSIWSNADKLTDDATRHWTNEEMRLTGLIRVDGETFRVIGNAPNSAAALPQTSTRVLPTRTICTFENAKIKLTLTFLTPTLPEDITLCSTPITYVLWDVSSVDGKDHDVTGFFGAAGDLARNDHDQVVKASASTGGDKVSIVKVGTVSQPILARAGDGVRIDWGYACLGGNGEGVRVGEGTVRGLIAGFVDKGELSTGEAGSGEQSMPGLGATLSFGPCHGGRRPSRGTC